ncbi:MAG TPA: phenylalanine--tRNA ligase subunit alpha [Acidimicrobiia bacterium]|nr:phenylalanine--tRNA ligase subunit alpha [Acidimicrobiia bacterium]
MDLDHLPADLAARLESVASLAELNAVENEFLGRHSQIAESRRLLGRLPVEERPEAGARLNEITRQISDILRERRVELERADANRLLEDDALDITLEAWRLPGGTPHLIGTTIREICDIFVGLGYRVAEGPEAELGWYNFDALNTPPTHPARLESDTLYLDYGDPADEMLLRTQTSPMQARYMEASDPPVYVVVPGKVYRNEAIDASHLPVFYQIEGLAVDQGITFSDLKGTLAYFAREYLGAQTRVQLRPDFFPFTEPSAQLLVSCFNCDGGQAGCRVCGGSGWFEVLGCGMVDPNVFTAVGYDPGQVTGFAFGMGVERLAMVRHGITNIRHFIDNDLRVLRQFR